MLLPKFNIPRYGRTYTFALLAVAAGILMSFVALHNNFDRMAGDSETLHLTAETVELVEDAARLLDVMHAAETRDERASAANELAYVIAGLEHVNSMLFLMPTANRDATPADMIGIHFGRVHELDRNLRRFIARAKDEIATVRQARNGAKLARALAHRAERELLPTLNAVLGERTVEAQRRIDQSKAIVIFLVVITLAALAVQGFAVLRPAARGSGGPDERSVTANIKDRDGPVFDALTGVINRSTGRHHLDRALAVAAESGEKIVVVHLDLDDFRRINEIHGDGGGDDALWQVADRLRCLLGQRGEVSRVGGDEFVLICKDKPSDLNAADLARNVVGALKEPFELYNGETIHIDCAMGIAEFPGDGGAANDLLVAAELALQKAKKQGDEQVAWFDHSMRETFNQRVAFAKRAALGDRQW